MKLLALVTLYYPPAHITDNLLTYAEDVDGLFVWDNTLPHSKTISVLSTMTKTVPILLIFLSSMLLAQTAMRRSKKHRG